MPATPAEILASLLIEGAFFNEFDLPGPWPICTSAMPDGAAGPDQCGTVYDTSGEITARLMAGGKNLVKFGVQLKTRSTDYNVAYSKLSAVTLFLETVLMRAITVDGNLYTINGIVQSSPVISMGQDERRRALCSVNLLLMLIGS